LNYAGLDRYNRQGVIFTFESRAKKFHYKRRRLARVIQRYPNSAEAVEAKQAFEGLINQTSNLDVFVPWFGKSIRNTSNLCSQRAYPVLFLEFAGKESGKKVLLFSRHLKQ